MENLTIQGLARMIGAGANLIYVLTDNEPRTEEIVTQAARHFKGMGNPYLWTCTEGLSRDGVAVSDPIDPVRALDFALAQPGPLLFLFKDLSFFWRDNPYVIRKLKDFSARARQKAIVITGQDEAAPEPLRNDLTLFQQDLPLIGEITAYFEEIRKREPLLASACSADPEIPGRLAVAAQGLDLVDIDRALRLAENAKGKGRFDEIFYVGLPDVNGREEIFRIHLAKQKVDPTLLDVSLLAHSTKGFSGAEIEQVVLSAVFEALADKRPVVQQDFMAAMSRTVPLSVTMSEQIKKIEAWAFNRAVHASGKRHQ